MALRCYGRALFWVCPGHSIFRPFQTVYFCFYFSGRTLALLIALCIYIPMIVASLLVLIGICLHFSWLLLPWLIIMPLDIIRGLVSTILILILNHGQLARIATGIFFLGLQFLHVSF